jgi:hypothetical protein
MNSTTNKQEASMKLTLREVAILEIIKEYNRKNGEPENAPVYEEIIKFEGRLFPKELIATTVASLVRRGLITKTTDTEGSILTINSVSLVAHV